MKGKETKSTQPSRSHSNRLIVRVVPNARRTEIAGGGDGVVRVRLQAPATEGRANEELIRFLAEVFGTRRSRVVLVRGEKAREKCLEIREWQGNGESAEGYAVRWAERAAALRGGSR
ncbi:hypothetical protein MAMC_01972 [Methylacidimicrobium cyclopophantes]|uniref:UPF0235 protein MAMC_01972 n=1 Tax=Methylacidimicrobium cyclopophantes TaxID=1041766 RepID=A0A5E6MG46_9BACT|nr:DUF167 domain-containing protein [Methylacidimicrobium cyclopophantes]VVM08081.1 hypothetical protein MAMC_01972 [Methylacidimicrobium cyclopophantes]